MFDQLHETVAPSSEFPDLNSSLTSMLAAAAGALMREVAAFEQPSAARPPPGTLDAAAAAAARLPSQLADMLYAMAVYAGSAGEAAQHRRWGPASSSSWWGCSSAASALLDAVAAAGSSWHMPSVARKVSVCPRGPRTGS